MQTLMQILLQIVPIATNSYNTYCTFAGSGVSSLNANGWINITAAVLAINFAISGVLYAIAGILPTSYREKIKGVAKYEAFQGLIACIILAVLIVCASTLCNVGQALVYTSTPQQYQNPLQFSQAYVQNLMFSTGLGLFNSIYAESIALTMTGNIADSLEQLLPELTIGPFIGFTLNAGLLGIFFGFSGALTSTFLGLIAVTFGVLFLIYLILPFIQTLAFTVVLPVALVMRCIPLAGPNLRQTSDTFLALAAAFYFIFPLTILLNQFIMTWIYTPCAVVNPQNLCNPYSQYNGTYQIPLLVSSDALFNTNPAQIAPSSAGFLGGTSIPSTFYSGAFEGLGGAGGGLQNILSSLVHLPLKIIQYGNATAQYIFQGIFLIGFDLAITVAFAMGLSKGLSSVGQMLGVGPFWGGY